MRCARILSTGACVPGDPIDNETMERLAGPLPPQILEGLQVTQRHWIVDMATGAHRVSNTELAYRAVEQALSRAQVEAGEVDLLVACTASPDYLLPPMVTFVQDRLGLRRCATIELRSGCAGAIEALDVARLYLERGLYRTAVVVGSETISPLLVPMYLGRDPETISMRERMVLYGFGDGAGALVLQAGDEGEGILGSAIACVGGGRKPGMQIIGAGTHAPIHEQLARPRLVEFRVDVVESGRFTPHVLIEALQDTLGRAGVAADTIDHCVIPEGNATYMTDELRQAGLLTPDWLAIEGKILENLSLVAATGSAAVPLALNYGWESGTIRTGDRLMLLGIETSKWKYAGMVLPWTAGPFEADPAGTRKE